MPEHTDTRTPLRELGRWYREKTKGVGCRDRRVVGRLFRQTGRGVDHTDRQTEVHPDRDGSPDRL